jgi:hypothetical protein
MLDEKQFDYILFGLIIVYALYVLSKNNEPFLDNFEERSGDDKQECSDKAVNKQIFDYVLSDLSQTKTPN